ncbi:MAG TPA: hypothetical protein ENK17_05835, partial [Anaerolineae bacterium]|nr:hypothetical protein [Anaerolineae bacterium]
MSGKRLLLLAIPLLLALAAPVTAQSPVLPGGMHVYYGDLHSHTSYSDGQQTPQDAYRSARANGLDFFSLTDHAEQLSDSELNDTLVQARAATVEGQFIAIRGFEWTSIYGHFNVFNSTNRARANDSRYDTIAEFYAWLSDPAQINALAQFNHPFYPPQDPFDAWRYDPLADLHVALIEVRNSSHLCEEEYQDALNAAWHVGGTNNSDTHQANWGVRRARTGILAPALTYHDVIESLRVRRTFATDDDDFSLLLRADDHWMGAILADGPYYLHIYARDPDITNTLASLELYHNGGLLRSFPVPAGARALTVTYALTATPAPGDWWYAKATQSDGEEAYTAPVWTLRPRPYDLVVRDNLLDEGRPPADDFIWESPDVWLRRQPDRLPWGQNLLPGATNYIHLRLLNRGDRPPTATQVSLYWAEPALAPAWPDDWHLISQFTADSAMVGRTLIVPWDAPASVPPHAALLVRLDSP